MSDRAEWLDERLAAAGLRRTGEITCPHDRPWSTVHTAQTTGGPVWLKAPGPGTVFEVALYELLARVTPAWVLHPIAVDLDRGWVLLPDGGTTLAESDTDLVAALVAVLPEYGRLQRALAPHTGALLSFGVADMRPHVMPDRFDEAVASVTATTGDPLDEVRAMRPAYAQWCARLAASPVPASIDHNDLHPGNVFADGDHIRFYDWGDAVVAHPFASMLLPAAGVRRRLGVGPDDAAVRRIRDAYLEVWSDLAPHRELVAELELACWVGKVARTLVWDRALRMQGHDQAREFADAPRQHLTGLLARSWSDLAKSD
ncbi:phosphotransferase [Actinophytocola sp. NPDC049390]|uniref:phosphotransferase n=1 Tax=Actinophytocola sp. NPDC049390 TaxID=3363894 RepID=UPI003795B762